MASLSTTDRHYKVRVYDASRDPKEKARYLSRDAWTKGEALAYLAKVEQAEERGWQPWTQPWPDVAQAKEAPTLMEAVGAYCEHKRRLGRRGQQGGWNERTHDNYLTTLSSFARSVGARVPATHLTGAHLEDWIFGRVKHGPGRGEPLAEATSRMYRRQLKTFLGWLAGRGYDMPALPRAFRAERSRVEDYPTERDCAEIVRAHRRGLIARTRAKHVPKSGPKSPLRRWPYSLAFRLAFYQGLRRGELVALRAGGVDLSSGYMIVGDETFVPKGRHERRIPVMPPARPIFACLLRAASGPSDRLFSLTRGKRLSDAFREARRAAFPHRELSFHDLRSGCCVYWLEMGLPVRDVQNLLRHESIKTTEQYYTRYVAEGARQRAEKVYAEHSAQRSE